MAGVFGYSRVISSSLARQSETAAGQKAAAAARKVDSVKMELRTLRENLAKALMINEALWEIIKAKHDLTEEDLNGKLYEIDMRDGQLDGKNQRCVPVECPQCRRKISPRRAACIYCGHVMDESVFSIG